MKEELVTFSTAKLAKEKGFNFYQPLQYSKGVKSTTLYGYNESQCKLFKDLYYASTQSLLQKWLREIHNISVDVYAYTFIDSKFVYRYKISQGYSKSHGGLGDFEKVLEEGLQKALNQIKI